MSCCSNLIVVIVQQPSFEVAEVDQLGPIMICIGNQLIIDAAEPTPITTV